MTFTLSHSFDRSQHATGSGSASRSSLLIADHAPDTLQKLPFLLEQHGHKVQILLDGESALKTIQVILPDLVLLDCNLPEIDGYEVCRKLKASPYTCDIPIIFCSNFTDVASKVKAFEVGGIDYIAKPFQIEEIVVRIENHLALRQASKQLLERNLELEHQAQARSQQLEAAVNLNGITQRIIQQMRDSLDETQILQTAMQELTQTLDAYGCDIAFYNLTTKTSTIWQEYLCSTLPSAQGNTVQMSLIPEVYAQLLQGQMAMFCPTVLKFSDVRGNLLYWTVLACPLVNENGVFGDMWFFKPQEDYFTQSEIELVQQMVDLCAIALRQARLHEASRSQIENLERLNRLKDDFLSTVSHELRTPISNIKLAVQMLELLLKPLGILEEDSRAARYFQILHDESQREIKLITDLLDLTRLDAGTEPLTLTTIDLEIWLSHVTEPFISRTQVRQQNLQLHIPAALPTITTDLGHLERIMTELLNNACRYTPKGETITISMQVLEREHHPPFTPEEQNYFGLFYTQSFVVQIKVSNTGVEIPASELEHIFDKFYRVPNHDPWKHGGTGLGLALVKKLVDRLGATISGTSQNGETTFMLELPIRCSKA